MEPNKEGPCINQQVKEQENVFNFVHKHMVQPHDRLESAMVRSTEAPSLQ